MTVTSEIMDCAIEREKALKKTIQELQEENKHLRKVILDSLRDDEEEIKSRMQSAEKKLEAIRGLKRYDADTKYIRSSDCDVLDIQESKDGDWIEHEEVEKILEEKEK